MKTYIGTKQIEAESMTMGEAYTKGLLQAGRVPNTEQAQCAGYHVKYQDGYCCRFRESLPRGRHFP